MNAKVPELTDFVGILTQAALDAPRRNKLKAGNAVEFYARIAFPPEAGLALAHLCRTVAPGGQLDGFQINVPRNADLQTKAIPGIPPDWLIVRAASQYAPYLADGAGAMLDQNNPAHGTIIKSLFYAGSRVRAQFGAYTWNHVSGGSGISFSLLGVMAAAEGERLNIGQGAVVNAFKRYADPNKAATTGLSHAFAQAATNQQQARQAEVNQQSRQAAPNAFSAMLPTNAGHAFAQTSPANTFAQPVESQNPGHAFAQQMATGSGNRPGPGTNANPFMQNNANQAFTGTAAEDDDIPY